MTIYDKTGKLILDIPVDDTSYRYRSIRQGDKVFLYYSLSEHVEVPLYSYIEFQGQRYTLWRPENFTKHGTRNLEYTLELGSYLELLGVTKYKHLSTKPHRLKFSLTGKPRFFLQLLVDNMNLFDEGWTIGTCIDAPEKTLAFSHEFCLDVLARFSDEWDTEFEAIGKTINFGKIERFKDDPLPLSYGRGNGFKTGVGRQNQGDKRPVSILHAEGGERNIDPTVYGSTTLLLPKSQELEYQGRRYRTDEDGTYIVRADRELLNNNEDSYDASHIYPSRVGTVSGVTVVDAEDNLYDITDSSIPQSLDYSDCRIPGEKAVIIFQSGTLTGEEFEIKQTQESLTGYIHAQRRFSLVPVQKNGTVIPNANRRPSVGDKYAVFNISLPEAYVSDDATRTGASWDMFREMVRYMYEHEEETFTFKGELDGIWSKTRWMEIGGKLLPGGYIFFSDTQFQPNGVLIRIIGIKDYINRPYSPEIELSNTPVAGFVSSELGKIESNEVKNEGRYQGALNYTKRRWRDAIEAQEMLEKAFDNYSKGIDPIWVRTMSLLVGDESLQFRFVDSRTNPQTVEPGFVYNDDTEVFTAPKSILQHMTLGISEIKGEHQADEYKYWDLPAYISPPLGDFGKMYLYAKCSKSNQNGNFLLSETPHRMDEGSYYYFLVGLLGSQFDGARSFVTVYGFTEVLPGRVTVDRIVSTDGNCYFNLGIGEIGGNLRVKSGSSGLKNFNEWKDFNYEITTELTVLGDRISAQVKRVDYINNTIETAGWITKADGNTWWASKTLENGNTIISYINQSYGSTTIHSNRINLEGAVSFSSLNSSLQSAINGKADLSDLGELAYKDAVEAAQLGSTIVIGGYLNTDLIKVRRLDATTGFIGGFTLDSGRLNWKARDYFANDSRSLKLGVSTTDTEGVVDVAFNAATTGRFGVKAVGSNMGGAAIYGSTGALTYPSYGMTYAGYFVGPVDVRDTSNGLISDVCASKSFRVIQSRNADGTYTYHNGVNWNKTVGSPDLDKIRLIVEGGIITGYWSE
ncbi:hypothetical protein [Parabacteroides goldsteinii]|jgi:hypothetical protein|uniref:hypothetical protein n=3 Tax=Parabacteroides goldsteinii TaxID=328812 RepID=UPI00256ED56E|nr:hypothetical protein [Parabacteroides goldsteinii]